MDSHVGISSEVHYRDHLGRFAAAIEDGAQRAMVSSASDGARIAAALAPKRTRKLAGSIVPFVISPHEVGWKFISAYGMAQEKGARPHIIAPAEPDDILANKEDDFFARGPVMHPGNPAVHFMRDSYRIISSRMMAKLRRNMPG
jgi:hypothetical protein